MRLRTITIAVLLAGTASACTRKPQDGEIPVPVAASAGSTPRPAPRVTPPPVVATRCGSTS